jgi:hypothetical protein
MAMSDQAPRGRSRARTILFALNVFTLMVVLCAVAAIPLFLIQEPRTDAEAVLEVHADLIEVALDPEHDGLWDLLSSQLRERVESVRDSYRSDPHPAKFHGRSTEDLLEMDIETYVSELYRRQDEYKPELRRKEIEKLRSLRILRVEMEGDLATVACDGVPWSGWTDGFWGLPDLSELGFQYVREDGDWRFDGISTKRDSSFIPLEWKVEAYLAKCSLDEFPEVDAVVTVGPEGLSDEAGRALTEQIASYLRKPPEEAIVVLDVAPTASWGTVVRAQDALRLAGVEEIYYAASTIAGPGPGVRVNGVSVCDPLGSEPLPDASIDAAVSRVITIGEGSERVAELRLVCPNPETVDGVPWVLMTTYTNLSGRPVRAPRWQDGDGTIVFVLTLMGRGAKSEVRLEVSGKPVGGVPSRVLLKPGQGLTRLDVVPRLATGWFVRVEVMDATGGWTRSAGPRLMTAGDDPWWPAEESSIDFMDDRLDDKPPPAYGDAPRTPQAERLYQGNAIVQLATATAAERDVALETLGKTVRISPDPTLRLLAALVARHLDPETGKRVLRELASLSGEDRALAEAADRLLKAD